MKILVVDDDPVTLDALAECIRTDGCDPVMARTGAEALSLWEQHHPDLICLDIMMPGCNGYEVCRRIRAHDSAVPILFLSAKNEEVDVVVGLELGADDFIRKPFSRNEVLARIRSALRRSKCHAASRKNFTIDGLHVCPEELRAERDGIEIGLSPREASLLAVLHENQGLPVSRDVLLDRCWGINYFPDSRTLDQHIAVLRKKIERSTPDPPIIETIRGVGYRMRK